MDHRNDWKQKLYDQYVRIDKTKGILTIGLLIANLSLTLWGLAGWGVNAYIGVPSIMLLLGISGVIFANIWVDGFGFYKNEKRAQVSLDPTQVYQQNPFQTMVWIGVQLPKMKALKDILESQGEKESAKRLQEDIERLEKWTKLRYIPKEDFPEDLKHHFIANEGEAI